MPLAPSREEAVAQRAVRWVQSVSKSTQRAATVDKAKILARQEYDASAYLARIVVADKARHILRAVNRAVRTGEISRTWANGSELDPLSAKGLSRVDPKLVFQNALRSALAAGVYDYAQDAEDIAYIEYVTQRDERVRYSHAALDRTCLPKGHSWFHSHTPPLAPNCRCKLKARTAAQFTRLLERGQVKADVPEESEVEHSNKATGERVTLPASVAPGYGKSPSAAGGVEHYREMLEARVRALLEAPEDAL